MMVFIIRDMMIDFYSQLRQKMIDTMQYSLRQLRQVLSIGVKEFGDLLGLTRQTVNNLENAKSNMTATQYISVCAVIDNCISEKPSLQPVLSTILQANEAERPSGAFDCVEYGSLLKKWFRCFPDTQSVGTLLRGESVYYATGEIIDIIENHKIFLDDAILCTEPFGQSLLPLIEPMQNCGKKFIVPFIVVEVIGKKLMSRDDSAAQAAKRGLDFLAGLQQRDLIEMRGEKDDVSVTGTLISVFARFKNFHDLVLFTGSQSLASQISALNHSDIGGSHIKVLRGISDGTIRSWDSVEEEEDISVEEALPMEDAPVFPENAPAEVMHVTPRGWESID